MTTPLRYFTPKEMSEQDTDVNPNCTLSDLDKAYMVINYPFQTKNPTWTLFHALNIVGIRGRTATDILTATDANAVRYKFLVWSAAKKVESTMRRPHVQDNRDPGDRDHLEVQEKGWCDSQLPGMLQQISGEVMDEPGIARGLGPARGVSSVTEVLWNPGDTIKFHLQQPEYQIAAQAINMGIAMLLPSNLREDRLYLLWNCMRQWADASRLTFQLVRSEAEADAKIYFFEEHLTYGHQGNNSWCAPGTLCRTFRNNPFKFGGTRSTSCYFVVPDGRLQGPGVPPENLQKALRNFRHELGHMLGLHHEHVNPLSLTEITLGDYDELIGIWTSWDPRSVMLYAGEPLRGDPPGRTTQFFDNLSDSDRIFVKVRLPQYREHWYLFI